MMVWSLSVTPRILVLHARAATFVEAIRNALPGADVCGFVEPAEAAQALAQGSVEVLVTIACNAEMAAHAKGLRWVQMISAGLDPLLPYRTQLRHCVVTNACGMHADQMADYAMAAMFMLHWDFKRVLRDQAQRHWRREPKAPLAGRTLGIIGLGAIGGEIARRARAAGMEVIGINRSGAAVDGVAVVHPRERLVEILPLCDFLLLVVPSTLETRAIIDEAALRRMKPTCFLINFARGSVVDEAALIDALREGRLAGAALDVFATEPLPRASPLWTMDRVIITPHIAGMSDDYEVRFAAAFAANLARHQRGEPLHNTVDLDRGY
jgi:phosphoglycerate dehydrogenase-like enzyme